MQKFVENITIRHLNPHNHTCGNDFMDNIWSWGIQLLPEFGKYVSGIQIKRCFVSEAYIKKELLAKDEDYNWEWKKFAYGLAIKLTWDNWSFETAMALSDAIFNDYFENTHCVIDTKEETLTIYRRMKTKKIREKTSTSMKTLRQK